MARNEQYPTGGSNSYVSKAAEEHLEGGNPFKQGSADEPIIDADAAAVSAVLSRDKPPPIIGTIHLDEKLDKGEVVPHSEQDREADNKGNEHNGHASTGQGHNQKNGHGNKLNIAPLFRPKEKSPVDTESGDGERNKKDENDGNDDDVGEDADRLPHSNGKPSLKHARGRSAEAGPEDVEDSDPEVHRITKRARRDSRSLLVDIGDDAREEERKMRANLGLRAVAGEGSDEDLSGQKADGASAGAEEDEQLSYTKEVKPMTTREGLLKPQGPEPASTEGAVGLDEVDEVDEQGDDDVVEAKRGDDYDVENYAEFEDDDDDMENLDPGERLV
ncbi:hypothetical protein P885DRAFT_74538 [Corynascus similis CBS 632.67]